MLQNLVVEYLHIGNGGAYHLKYRVCIDYEYKNIIQSNRHIFTHHKFVIINVYLNWFYIDLLQIHLITLKVNNSNLMRFQYFEDLSINLYALSKIFFWWIYYIKHKLWQRYIKCKNTGTRKTYIFK